MSDLHSHCTRKSDIVCVDPITIFQDKEKEYIPTQVAYYGDDGLATQSDSFELGPE